MDNFLQRAFLGRPLDKVLKGMAIVDLVTGLFGLGLGIWLICNRYGGIADALERSASDVKGIASEDEIARAHEQVRTEMFVISSISLAVVVADSACEMYLFGILWSASNDGNATKLKRWWWIRLGVSLFNTSLKISGIVALGLKWFDITTLMIFLYRFAELVLVRGFRKQVA
ncbi:unnamed protein product [Orchesella dallaii]|uniref:Uncharacterized protein n=1 Tax=Orchesella dallaii TaxID=48710 RepID=A0ABP1RJS2_9HEXA